MKFGVADYGFNVWDGGFFDLADRLERLKAIGYDGLERLQAISADQAVGKAVAFRRLGMDFGTCLGPTPETSLEWTAAFGKSYVWAAATGKEFDTYCRQVNGMTAAASRLGLQVGLHNHMGSLVESQAEVEAFLEACPQTGLILDTAHLAGVGGDPIDIVRRYHARIVAMHLKDWIAYPDKADAEHWSAKGRFCELGAGNIGLDNGAVMRELINVGYDGWVFVEHDTHLQDPIKDLAISREYLRERGF